MVKNSTIEGEPPKNESGSDPGTPIKPHVLSRYMNEFDSEDKIGKGGYGRVVSCRNILDEMYYAMKKVPFNNDEREKILREVRALARLKHRNIVRYYQAWIEPYQDGQDLSSNSSEIWEGSESLDEDINSHREVSGAKEYCLYIQMELCNRALLDQLIKDSDEIKHKDSNIKTKKAWNYFQQIVEGVDHIHQMKVIHRDLSLQNILLVDDSIKISDFGLAKICKEGELLCPSGPNLGNQFYRAPEMENEQSEINSKVDIFSLGIILFELVHPFKTQYERFKVLTVLRKDKEFPGTWEEQNNSLANLIRQLLSEKASDRPSAAQILQQHPWEKYTEEVAALESGAVINAGADIESANIENVDVTGGDDFHFEDDDMLFAP